MKPSRHACLWLFALISVFAFALSQLSSYLVNAYIPVGETVEVTGFLHFTHIRNLGGVFGILQGKGWLFALISVAVICALVLYLATARGTRPYEYICFAFIAGGGSSNVADRLIYGSVVDFINVQHIPYWHYIFNTADMMVHVGLWPMLFISLFGKDREKAARTDTRDP